MKPKRSFKYLLLPVLLFSTVFLFFLFPEADADLGWHLKYGEHFLATGSILKANTFSWVMPEYVWPNHSWGYDVFAALLFKLGSFTALSLTAAVLISASYLLLAVPGQKITVPILLVFLYFGSELLNVGLKSQLISFIFFALFWLLIIRFLQMPYRHIWWSLPLLFLVWSNFHGQFILPLVLLTAYLVINYSVYLPYKNKQAQWLLPATVLSWLATLINPFGIELLHVAVDHAYSPAQAHIYEWMPWELNTPRMQWFIVYSVVMYGYILWKKLPLKRFDVFCLILLNILSLRSRRMIPFFLLASIPFMSQAAWSIAQTKFKLAQLKAAETIILIVLIGISLLRVLPSRQIFTQNWNVYCQQHVLCSEPLLSFLRQNQIHGKILNSYRLGGWLDYRYPENPVFIDGRMTLWQNKRGEYPFLDFIAMAQTDRGFDKKLLQYQFDYLLLHHQYPLAQLGQKQKWPVIYQDDKVVLYKNPFK